VNPINPSQNVKISGMAQRPLYTWKMRKQTKAAAEWGDGRIDRQHR
jgi:hypothetical protein